MLDRVELDAVGLERVEIGKDDSPLAEIEYSGNVEEDCAAEFAVVETAFQSRAKEEARRFDKATDSEYWVCLVFQTRAQVEEFLTNCGHQSPTEKYVDGAKFAAQIGRPVTPNNTKFGTPKIDKTWSKFTEGESDEKSKQR